MPELAIPNPLSLPEPETLADVRAAVDEIDRALALTLARRAFYVRHAVRFKDRLDDPQTAERRKHIVATAVSTAEPLGAPGTVVEAVFETMISRFLELQADVLRQLRASAPETTARDRPSDAAARPGGDPPV